MGFSFVYLKARSLALFFYDLWHIQLFPGWYQGHYSTSACLLRLGFHFYNWWYNLGLSLCEGIQWRKQPLLLAAETKRQKQLVYPSAFHLSWQAIDHLPPNQSTRLAYGETSWFALCALMKVVQPTSSDVFCDLGCGAGRTLLYMHLCHGMRAVGIELLPALVQVVEQVQQELGLSEVAVRSEDFLTAALPGVTIAYITANGLDNLALSQLSQHLQTQLELRWVLSVGKPLTFNHFGLKGTYRLWFSWGRDWVYVYQRQEYVKGKKYHLKGL